MENTTKVKVVLNSFIAYENAMEAYQNLKEGLKLEWKDAAEFIAKRSMEYKYSSFKNELCYLLKIFTYNRCMLRIDVYDALMRVEVRDVYTGSLGKVRTEVAYVEGKFGQSTLGLTDWLDSLKRDFECSKELNERIQLYTAVNPIRNEPYTLAIGKVRDIVIRTMKEIEEDIPGSITTDEIKDALRFKLSASLKVSNIAIEGRYLRITFTLPDSYVEVCNDVIYVPEVLREGSKGIKLYRTMQALVEEKLI